MNTQTDLLYTNSNMASYVHCLATSEQDGEFEI